MRVNRGLLNWGVFLVTAGVVALAFRYGYLSTSWLGDVGRLWPVLLIALGIAVILGQVLGSTIGGTIVALFFGVVVGVFIGGGARVGCTVPNEGEVVSGGAGGMFASEPATVDLNAVCGELRVTAAPGDQWSVQRTGDRAVMRLASSASSLSVWSGEEGTVPSGSSRGPAVVTLPTNRQLNVRVVVSAGSTDLDLSGARLAGASLTVNAGSLTARLSRAEPSGAISTTTNAGSLNLELPTDRAIRATITTNAGSTNICVPPNAPIRIESGGALGDNNFDDFGLTQRGNTWESAGYASATNKIDLNVTTNAGSTELEQPGECT